MPTIGASSSGRATALDLPERRDRPAVIDVRAERAHRSDAGPWPRRQPASLRRLVAADHLPRCHRVGSKVHDVPVALAMPPGDVRGLDVRTGKQLWQFRAVPLARASSATTAGRGGSWKTTGGANVWTLVSADGDLRYVYLPISTPVQRFLRRPTWRRWPVRREPRVPGCAHGKRIWHFQMVHHGLWDYELFPIPIRRGARWRASPVAQSPSACCSRVKTNSCSHFRNLCLVDHGMFHLNVEWRRQHHSRGDLPCP